VVTDFVVEIAGKVEATLVCFFEFAEEYGKFVEGLRRDDFGGIEEEIAVVILLVEA
jgi:hypothetical protein